MVNGSIIVSLQLMMFILCRWIDPLQLAGGQQRRGSERGCMHSIRSRVTGDTGVCAWLRTHPHQWLGQCDAIIYFNFPKQHFKYSQSHHCILLQTSGHSELFGGSVYHVIRRILVATLAMSKSMEMMYFTIVVNTDSPFLMLYP